MSCQTPTSQPTLARGRLAASSGVGNLSTYRDVCSLATEEGASPDDPIVATFLVEPCLLSAFQIGSYPMKK